MSVTAKDIWLMGPEEYADFLQEIKQEAKARFPEAKPRELKKHEIKVMREKIAEGGTS